jgi:hypothetical protein
VLLPYILNNLDGGDPASCARLLLETGDVLLVEDGGFFLLEHSGTCGGGAFELPTDVGTYAVAGSAADLLVGRVLDGAAGSYTITGSAADLLSARVLSTDVGTYAIAGSAADLSVGHPMVAEPGAYVIAGSSAGLFVGRVLETVGGAYVVTGSPADLVAINVYELETEPGAYTVTGADAPTLVGYVLGTEVGAYELTGVAADLLFFSPVAEPGAYTITGFPAELDYSAAVVTFTLESLLTRRMRRSAAISDEDRWIFHHEMQVDLETGVGIVSGQGSNPTVMLRWSDDGGETWSNEVHVSAGKMGEYTRRAIWRRLGRSRDRVYEVVVSDPVAWNLLGAFLKVEKGLH